MRLILIACCVAFLAGCGGEGDVETFDGGDGGSGGELCGALAVGQDFRGGKYIAAIGANYADCDDAWADVVASCEQQHQRPPAAAHERCGTYRRIFSNTTTQRCGAVAFGSARRNDEIVTNYAFGHAPTLAVAEKRARDYCRIGMRNAGIHETISATVCEVPDRGSKCNDPLF